MYISCSILQIMASDKIKAKPKGITEVKSVVTEKERLTLTVEEAAEILGLSRPFAYKLANEGKLPVLRIGRRILVSKVGLLKMLEAAGELP